MVRMRPTHFLRLRQDGQESALCLGELPVISQRSRLLSAVVHIVLSFLKFEHVQHNALHHFYNGI
jgi:hypothetical protein